MLTESTAKLPLKNYAREYLLSRIRISIFFEEHRRRRLDVKAGKSKCDLINSTKYTNMGRMAGIEILSESKLTAIHSELVALKICIELTPEIVNTFFVGALIALLEGFDVITIDGEELLDKLSALEPCDLDAFRSKVEELVAGYAKGKDNSKLRIIVR